MKKRLAWALAAAVGAAHAGPFGYNRYKRVP